MQIIKKSPNPIQDLSYLDMEKNNNSLMNGIEEVAQGFCQIALGTGYGDITINFQEGKPQLIRVTENHKVEIALKN